MYQNKDGIDGEKAAIITSHGTYHEEKGMIFDKANKEIDIVQPSGKVKMSSPFSTRT